MKRRVLIVDDNDSLRAGLAKLVETLGHEAVTAPTVNAGLANLAGRPSHVILDMNLPDGLGTTILRHVRTAGLPIKVALLSGSTDTDLLAEGDALEPDAVFRKPPDWGALIEWLSA